MLLFLIHYNFVAIIFVNFFKGVIILYRLYHNGLFICNDSSQLSFTINNLLPWSLHSFVVEACTVIGCSSSNEVSARTQESSPVGVIGINVIVDGPRQVRVLWTNVAVPNGLLYYDVYFEGLFYVAPGSDQ